MRELTLNFLVKEEHSAANIGSGLLDVLASPALIAFMEQTALTLLQADLTEEQSQVGIEVHLNHLAATPIGREISVLAVLVEQYKRIYSFEISAYDGDILIGKATHKRAIVDTEPFLAKIN